MVACYTMNAVAPFALIVVCPLFPALTQAQNGAAANPGFAGSVPPAGTIPAGTTITVDNWQKYKQFMPDGMIALFQAPHYWKMPANVGLAARPTEIHPFPKTYPATTD